MTATCPACSDNPDGGVYLLGCRGCAARHIAAGPQFFASMRAGRILQAYRDLLEALGPDVATAHAEVRAAAKRVKTGAVPA